jgi:hypothetical protein
MTAPSWTIDDAEELAALYPDTFLIAPLETRAGLEPGEYAKLIFRFPSAEHEYGEAVERMWLVVFANDNGRYRGRLANTPASKPDDDGFDYGAWVEFEARHIINWEYASEESKASVANPEAEF